MKGVRLLFASERRLLWACLAAMGLCHPASAQLKWGLSATGQYEHNSNVFNLESGGNNVGNVNGAPIGTVGTPSDSYYAYGAGFDLSYKYSRQELYLTGSTKEYDYQRFTDLNHNDYNLDGGWRWAIGSRFDGRFDVARQHSMVPFFDLGQTILSLQTMQTETAEAGWRLNSDWRLEGKAIYDTLDQPIIGAPDLQLKEKTGQAAVKYTGLVGFTAGLDARYRSGDYGHSGGPQNPSYHESMAGLTASYKLTGRTTFDGEVGYSKRSSSFGNDNQNGLTGHLKFKDQLTHKTSFSIGVSRELVNYVANAGSETDTGVNANVSWQATHRVAIEAGYIWTLRDYPRQGNNPPGSDRVDHQRSFTVAADYLALRWLTIKPYANILKRSSDFIGGDFDSTIFGVQLVASFGSEGHAAPAPR